MSHDGGLGTEELVNGHLVPRATWCCADCARKLHEEWAREAAADRPSPLRTIGFTLTVTK
jgi:hypothetical protein